MFNFTNYSDLDAFYMIDYINASVGYSSEDKKAEASEFFGRGNP